LAELTIFGRSGEALKRLAELGTRADREQALQNRIHAWLGGAMVFLMRLSAWLMLALSVRLAGDGAIEPVFIASLVVMTLACFEAVIPLPEAFQNYGQTAAAARRLVRLTEQTAAQPGNGQTAARTEFESGMASETAGGAIRRRTVPGLAGGPVLEVRNLSYRYHPDEPRALRDLSLTLRPGRKIAIVGESGAGKSTFLHLLLRLRPFEEGQILLDGTDIRTMSPERVREHFAVVSQRVQLFNATVEDNLRIAKPDATLEEMREAARLAMIDDVIMGMPDGYRTVIGEWGARLSGGERQRLALARALLRDAPFVLFDEPATGLDPLTERSVRHNLDHRLKDKGILWITHKLAGLDRMDEIIVLGNGAVTERGTHAELVATGGGYARMWWLERQFGT
jgi:ABC-type transport system involved in cytochrome bd biosynthesis fused ATPase/permease subunit